MGDAANVWQMRGGAAGEMDGVAFEREVDVEGRAEEEEVAEAAADEVESEAEELRFLDEGGDGVAAGGREAAIEAVDKVWVAHIRHRRLIISCRLDRLILRRLRWLRFRVSISAIILTRERRLLETGNLRPGGGARLVGGGL